MKEISSFKYQHNQLKLFTDSAVGVSNGCGIYFDGKWACLNWPSEWEQGNILKDITYLELRPIVLSVYLSGNQWHERKYYSTLTISLL